MNITERKLVQINVDVQNDFCPGGALAVDFGDEVTTPLNKMAEVVREEGGLVIATQDFHPVQTAHFDKWPVHCVGGTPGADFHPNLDVKQGDIIIKKGTEADEDAYSGFEGRGENGRTLEEIILHNAGARTIDVIIGGLATDYCVLNTVLDALEVKKKIPNKLAVYALTDAMRAVNAEPGDGEKSLKEMESKGAILTTTDEVTQQIRRGAL